MAESTGGINQQSMDIAVTQSDSDFWSLGCDIIVEDIDMSVREIKVDDISLSGNVIIEGVSVDIDAERANVMDLDVNVVIDGISSSIVESQVVSYDKILKINDLSPESVNESIYAASARSAKKIHDFISSVDNNTERISSRVEALEKAMAEGGGSGGGGGEGFSYWVLEDGKLYSNYDIYVRGNAVIEGDTSSGGSGQDTPSAGGSLSNLSDVSLGSLSEGDVLVYDKDNGVWYNVPQSKIVPNLEGYAEETWVTENFLKSDTLDAYKEELGKEIKEIADLLNSMWRIEDNKIVTDMDVLVKANLIVECDTSSGGEGQDTPAEGTVTGIEVNGTPYEPNTQGVIDLSDAFNAIDVSDQLKDYYTSAQTDSAISNAIANLINGAPTTLDTLKEIADALAENEDVVDALEEAIGKKADNTTVTALAERVSANEGAIDDNAGNIKKNFDAIDALDKRVTDEEAVTTTYKTWWADLKKYIKVEGGNVKIDTNLIVEGDTSSGGSGQDTPASGTVTGIKVSASETLTPNNAGIIDMVSVLSSIDVSDQLANYLPLSGGTISGRFKVGDYIQFTRLADSKTYLLGQPYADDATKLSFYDGSAWRVMLHSGNYATQIGDYYLKSSGGTIDGVFGALSIKRNNAYASAIRFENTSGVLGYIGINDDYNARVWDKNGNDVGILLHSGNYSSYALPLSGGTIDGNLTIGKNDNTAFKCLMLVRSGHGVRINNIETQAYFTFGAVDSSGYMTAEKVLLMGDGGLQYSPDNATYYTLIHSGNIGSQSVAAAQKLVDASTGATRISVDTNSYIYLTSRIHWGDGDWYSIGSYTETSGVPPFGRYIFYSGHIFKTASGEALRINSSGNVVVAHDIILNHIVIDGSNNIYSDNGLFIQPYGGGDVNINYLGTKTILNPNGGNVLIGTTTDSGYKLDVNGDIRIKPLYGSLVFEQTAYLKSYGNKRFLIHNENGLFLGLETTEQSTQIYGKTIGLNAATTITSTLSVGGGATVSGALNGTQIRLSNNIPLVFTNQGSGTYTQAVVEYTSSGFVFERARKTDSGSGEIIPLVISQRGGGVAAKFDGNNFSVTGDTNIGGNLVVSGDTSSGSDIRFKDIIKNKTIKIADIAKAPLFTFKWNDREDDTIHLGSSAQYWEKVTPWLVKGEDFKTLDYSTLGVAMGISLAKKAVNHEERIKVLEKENKALKEEIRRMQYGS